MRIHHVQAAYPRGREDDARRFYGAGLGMTEVVKPAELAKRGGAWFGSFDEDGVAELEAVGSRLTDAGFEVDRSQRDGFPVHARFHTFDGHGNRVEPLAPI